MKEGSLFVLFVLMKFIEPRCLKLHSWSLWKALEEKGLHPLAFMVFGLAV
jgi:hypothetical protein